MESIFSLLIVLFFSAISWALDNWQYIFGGIFILYAVRALEEKISDIDQGIKRVNKRFDNED